MVIALFNRACCNKNHLNDAKHNSALAITDFTVAERVYGVHRKRPIELNGSELEIELESPDLLDYHDNHSVRLSGLTPDLDPEKLKFYISALSDNTVSEILFDGYRCKAVAQFANPIGE